MKLILPLAFLLLSSTTLFADSFESNIRDSRHCFWDVVSELNTGNYKAAWNQFCRHPSGVDGWKCERNFELRERNSCTAKIKISNYVTVTCEPQKDFFDKHCLR